jgi:type IV secretion system protein VirB6
MSTVFTDFLNNVDVVVNAFLIGGYTRVRDAFETPLRLCLTLFVAVYGVLMLTGRSQLSFRDAFGKLGVALFVYVLATNADFYTNYIERLFVQSPNAIADVVVGGGGGGGQNGAMDRFYTTGMNAGDKLWNRGNLYTLSPLFGAVVVYAITLGVAAYAAFLLALAKIALAVLLILTPVFALFYLFGPTRKLFDGWLGQAIHYAIVPILVYGVLALILAIAQAQVQQIDANSETATFPQVLGLALAGIVAILLLIQIPYVAAGIAGGVALTTMGTFRDALYRTGSLSSATAGALSDRRQRLWTKYFRRQPRNTPAQGGNRVA